jgi:hypothetical protein
MTRPPEAYQWLPHFAKVAIERLDADSNLRNGATLDLLLDSYASSNGETCDAHTRESAHYRCARRFGDTFTS